MHHQCEPEYMGMRARLVALIVDGALVVLVMTPLAMFVSRQIGHLMGASVLALIASPTDCLFYLGVPAISAMFVGVGALLMFEQTPGMKLIGAEVVDARSGGVVGFGQSALRGFAAVASLVPMGLGFFWVAIDSRKQAWHDKAAGTIVIRSKKRWRQTVRCDHVGEHKATS